MRNAFTQILKQSKARMVIAGFLLAALAFLTFASPLQASDKRAITIFADGRERTISTNAHTVGEALEKAEISLDSHDLVEPSKETEIQDTAFRVNVYRARPVTVVDGHHQQTVVSPYQSARLIASEANIDVYPEDAFTLERVDDILATGSIGQKLIIDRAIQVNLSLYGDKLELRTQATTVAELLEEKGIVLKKGETLTPKPETKLKAGTSVFISRVGTKIVNEESKVPFEEEVIQDSSLAVGTRVVKQAGVLGRKTTTYEIVIKDGKEIGRKTIHEIITSKPSKQIVVVGTKGSVSGDVWAALRQCESGGNYANTNNPTYRGAYQFSYGTWAAMGGSGDPAAAPPAEQDLRARMLQERSGWGQWPACSAKLGLR